MSHLYHLKHTHHIKVPSLHHAATQQHAYNRTGAAWGKANCLCLTRGQLDDDNIFMKSVVTQQYLLGYELPDTMILLSSAAASFSISSQSIPCSSRSSSASKSDSSSDSESNSETSSSLSSPCEKIQ